MLVGVSDKAVSKWENGSAKPQIKTLYKLSEVLGITVDELLACKYHSVKNRNEKGVFAMKICIRHMRIEFYFTFRFPKTNVPGYVSMSAR